MVRTPALLVTAITLAITVGSGPTALPASGEDAVPQAVARAAQPDCGPKQHRKADGTMWVCTFAEEFDGRKLNKHRWQAIATRASGYTSGNECFRTGRKNVRVADGKVHLTIRKLPKAITCHVPRGKSFRTRYTAGSITTHGLFSQTYGRFQVRAKFPSSRVKGLQSAIWMTPQHPRYGAWPRSGEIDIVEHYSRRRRRAIPYLHYMYGFPATPLTSQTNNHCLIAGKKEKQRFHTYVAEWEPGRIQVSIDGKPCLDHTVAPMLPWRSPQPFDHPFVFNLTHLLGVASNKFDPKRTELPSTFVVDHWRAWQ